MRAPVSSRQQKTTGNSVQVHAASNVCSFLARPTGEVKGVTCLAVLEDAHSP